MTTYPTVPYPTKPEAFSSDDGIKGPVSASPQNGQPILETYSASLLLKGLHPATCNIYYKKFKRFLLHHPQSDINTLGYKDLLNYLKAQTSVMSPSVLKQTVAAIKIYYEHTLGRRKMHFPLSRDKSPSLSTLYLPFYDLEEITDNIDSPGDKLLLFLVYHARLKLSEICQLPKDGYYVFQRQWRLPGNNEQAIQYFQGLVADCQDYYHQKSYLFEHKGKAHTLTSLKQKLFWILAHHKLDIIYRKQYQKLLKKTHFSPRTQAMYLNAFMKFLKHFNYKHPANIRNEDICNYRALHRNKPMSCQNTMVSSFQFFFEKIHKRPLSRQHVMRPRKDAHLSHSTNPETSPQKGTTKQPKPRIELAWAIPIYLSHQENKHCTHKENESLLPLTTHKNHSPP